ncbi:Clavaminate synthase-like protein [Dichomitus squalens]|uniref:Clavaminate synthase-like protein n=1 Tax=Dichomitus squalens TaxID=114155 RepID=A0A4Q9M702_9APHY|nr:Clavaminate synthase-like protein [Dichomitus squalens]
MPGLTTYPPFPDDIPTCPLLIVDYELVKAGDEEEINKLWKAATELGFWYLTNHGVDEVDDMFEMGRETMALPLEEKNKFEQGEHGGSFGYKGAGVQIMDDHGTRDVTEFINVAKDDALAWPAVAHRTYPATVNARMDSTIKPFVQKSMEINHFLIDVLNDKLGLPKGTLAEFHKAHEHSGCIARVIRAPPHPVPEEKLFLTAHTDYGSLSFLHNRLGGLQVLPPGSDKWLYVKPLPGHGICNVGDALNIFSGGIIRSNIHRVIPPPKDQAQYERWSLVYFTRPNDTVHLRHQGVKSAMIAEAIAKAPAGRYEPGMTAAEWLTRRIRSQRGAYYNDPESKKDRRGTEDTAIPGVGYA